MVFNALGQGMMLGVGMGMGSRMMNGSQQPYRRDRNKRPNRWQNPDIENAMLVDQYAVRNPGILQIELWKGSRGYYVYFRHTTGQLTLSSGPHKLIKTATDHARTQAQALQQ